MTVASAYAYAADAPADATRRFIARWLFLCAFCVLLMVTVGGLTRLTESGLSIVDWRPVTGVLPPLSHAEWEHEFTKYQASPQYRKINLGMTLGEFQGIFFLEYVHRLLGRAIGLVFLLPMGWLWATGRIAKPLAFKLLGVFALGGLQGLFGWLMVKSGLQDVPAVSHLRLTLHLGTAVVLFGLLLWMALQHALPPRVPARVHATTYRLAKLVTAVVFAQILLGGLVAGLDAGRVYTTFPLMNGYVLPPEAFDLTPWAHNLIENHALVQFNHRLGAYAVGGAVFWLWLSTRRTRLRRVDHWLIHATAVAVAAQIMLGVLTLINAVPVGFASLHQTVAVMLFGLALTLTYRFKHVSETAA